MCHGANGGSCLYDVLRELHDEFCLRVAAEAVGSC